jgi:hypothetical protein
LAERPKTEKPPRNVYDFRSIVYLKMGWDARVTLVYGVNLLRCIPPLQMHSDQVEECDKYIIERFPFLKDAIEDISLPISLEEGGYTLQSYTNSGKDYCVFIQLKTYEMCVCRTPTDSPLQIQGPNEEEVCKFKKFLADHKIDLPYGTYMVIASG